MEEQAVRVDLDRWRRVIVLLLAVTVGLLTAGCAGSALEGPAPTNDLSVEEAATTAEPADEPDSTSSTSEATDAPSDLEVISLDHIHGMGWDADGEALTVATHTGLRIFEANRWFNASGPAHDYIALAPTADGFYASGHPVPSESEGDPLGLVKSADQGESLEMLSFEGESEIHFLGAGYETNAVYVVIDAENNTAPAGLHYTLDDGKSWHASAAQGITSVTIQLAAHPTDPAIIAFGAEGGVLLSTDNGDSFTRITESTPFSAVAFSPAEPGVLYYGLDVLMRLEPDGSDPIAVNMPALHLQDAIIAIAINPQARDEIAIATFDSYVWRTLDGGQNWQLIADPAAE